MLSVIKQFAKYKAHTGIFLDSLCIAFALLVGFLDYISGTEISLIPFYLLPVLVASWSGRKWSGFVLAFVCGILWGIIYSGLDRFSSVYSLAWNTSMRIVIFLFFSYLSKEMQKIILKLHKESTLARTDSLTGSMNYRSFSETSDNELRRFKRHGHPLTLIYLDIDNFKTVNDTAGHTAGDNLLCAVAQVIKMNIRSIDALARLGGDEFAILLPETNPEMAKAFIKKIQKILSNHISISKWPITFSFGVATFLKSPTSVEDMIRIADETMYKVKNSGKNNVMYKVFE